MRTLLLCHISWAFMEGRCCPVAAFGHSRDGKPAEQQLVLGLPHARPTPVQQKALDLLESTRQDLLPAAWWGLPRASCSGYLEIASILGMKFRLD